MTLQSVLSSSNTMNRTNFMEAEIQLDVLSSDEAWSLFSFGIVILIIGSPLSTLVAISSSILAKREYASFINTLIAFYSAALGKTFGVQLN